MIHEDTPTQFGPVPRILVFGDLHGDIGHFMKALYALRIINPDFQWTAEPPNTVIVQLGDQVDSMSRGTIEDWEVLPDTDLVLMMDRLDALARPHGGRVISLVGNHEMMNALGDFTYVSPKSMSVTGVEGRNAAFRPGGSMALRLARRNVVVRIGEYVFCHGGLLPRHLDMVQNNLHRLNMLMRKFFRDEHMSPSEALVFREALMGDASILWTRLYLTYASNSPEALHALMDGLVQRLQCKAIFVGHNTVPQITPVDEGRCWFVDACFSRAYPDAKISVVEIRGDQIQVLTVLDKK